MLLLRRRLPLLSAAYPHPSAVHHRSCLLSTSTAPFSLKDYLVAACGLTPAQARRASQQAFDEASRKSGKPIEKLTCPRLNSASNPDAVLSLLSGVGLSRADIAAVVAADPLILRSSVKNIGPRLLALRDRLGLSAPQIAQFLLVGSRALKCRGVGQSVEFFVSFFGSFEQLLALMKRNNTLLMLNLDRVIKPNIALLHQCSLSARDIVQLCSRNPRVLAHRPERMKDFVLRADALGVPRSSMLFRSAMAVVSSYSKKKVAAKLEFLERTLGCSESEASIAMCRVPSIVGISDDKLLRKIEFLVNEVGWERQYILERPVVFSLSLEKRLVPRHHVMKVLQAKGLLNSNISFYSLAPVGEENFRLKFVECHKASIPDLADAYATACAGIVPSGV